MQYRHAPAANHADLDAVLVSAPGRPSLPVRLTLELFGRCRAHLGGPDPVAVWDPCCGTGALLTTLGLLRRDEVAALLGSDADPEPLRLAARNLALLDPGGLDDRAAELDVLARRHGKPGYRDAAGAAPRLVTDAPGVPYEIGAVDAFDPGATASFLGRTAPRIVLVDTPYGRQTRWAGDDRPGDLATAPEAALLSALAPVVPADAVVAIVSRARRVDLPAGAPVLERVRAGHRAAVLVRAGDHR